jgi:hypothetical protein
MLLLAVKERESTKIDGLARVGWSGEAVAFCPGCKALQTVWINGDKLIPTRKFTQERDEIYHDCGSSRPCRLYVSW